MVTTLVVVITGAELARPTNGGSLAVAVDVLGSVPTGKSAAPLPTARLGEDGYTTYDLSAAIPGCGALQVRLWPTVLAAQAALERQAAERAERVPAGTVGDDAYIHGPEGGNAWLAARQANMVWTAGLAASERSRALAIAGQVARQLAAATTWGERLERPAAALQFLRQPVLGHDAHVLLHVSGPVPVRFGPPPMSSAGQRRERLVGSGLPAQLFRGDCRLAYQFTWPGRQTVSLSYATAGNAVFELTQEVDVLDPATLPKDEAKEWDVHSDIFYWKRSAGRPWTERGGDDWTWAVHGQWAALADKLCWDPAREDELRRQLAAALEHSLQPRWRPPAKLVNFYDGNAEPHGVAVYAGYQLQGVRMLVRGELSGKFLVYAEQASPPGTPVKVVPPEAIFDAQVFQAPLGSEAGWQNRGALRVGRRWRSFNCEGGFEPVMVYALTIDLKPEAGLRHPGWVPPPDKAPARPLVPPGAPGLPSVGGGPSAPPLVFPGAGR